MNRVLPTLHGGSLKITLSLPLTLEICITESVIAWYIPEFRHTVLLLNGFHRLPRFSLLSPPYTPYSPYTVHNITESLDTHRLQCILGVWIPTNLLWIFIFTVHIWIVRIHAVVFMDYHLYNEY